MSNLTKVSDLSCIFISYDEPNAEEHWADLLIKQPNAKRVHGVKGFDAAHKAAANLSDTDYFVTVDADTIVDHMFFAQLIQLSAEQHVFSSRHNVTGILSGNGSLKIWLKDAVLSAKTHEAAEHSKHSLDFWNYFDVQYHITREYGVTYPNSSPFHTYRSAYREAYKSISLLKNPNLYGDVAQHIIEHCYGQLEVLGNIGIDSKYGIYSIIATLDAVETYGGNENDLQTFIGDYSKLDSIIESKVNKLQLMTYQELAVYLDKLITTCNQIVKAIHNTKIRFDPLKSNQSMAFKAIRSLSSDGARQIIALGLSADIQRSYTYPIYNVAEVFYVSPHDVSKIYSAVNDIDLRTWRL